MKDKVSQYFQSISVLTVYIAGTLTLIHPVQAREVILNGACEDSIQSVKTRLSKTPNLKIVNVRAFEQQSNEEGRPADRPINVSFSIDAARPNNRTAVQSVMKSPQLLTSLSRQIIESCSQVATVTVGVHRSGWHESNGIFESGNIRPFQCFEGDPRKKRMPYGYMNCDI